MEILKSAEKRGALRSGVELAERAIKIQKASPRVAARTKRARNPRRGGKVARARLNGGKTRATRIGASGLIAAPPRKYAISPG